MKRQDAEAHYGANPVNNQFIYDAPPQRRGPPGAEGSAPTLENDPNEQITLVHIKDVCINHCSVRFYSVPPANASTAC